MNEFFVSVQGTDIVFLRPVPQKLTRAQAIQFAAWIAIIADPGQTELKAAIEEITAS